MRRNKLIKRFCCGIISAALIMSLTACGGTGSSSEAATGTDAESANEDVDTSWYTNSDNVVYTDDSEIPTLNWNVAVSVEDMFTDRDLSGDYDEKASTIITLADGDTSVSKGKDVDKDEGDVSVDGDAVTISSKGTYILSGSLSNGQIIVDAGDEKVQLVLDGVDITCENSAVIYVKSADKVFVTSAKGSENVLETSGEFEADGDINVDGVIFSKDDITFNGEGSLTVTTETGHGIVSKDDLKITAGAYVIEALNHGIAANDSIRIAGGELDITCGEDGLHTNNFEDEGRGFVYIQDGTIRIAAGDDGIHASLNVRVDGGDIIVSESYEGIEGQTIDINGGNIDVTASDDGFNAASSSMDSGDEDDDFDGKFGGGKFDGGQFATDTDAAMQGGKMQRGDMNQDGTVPELPDGEEWDGTMPDGSDWDGEMPDMSEMPDMPDGNLNQDGEVPELPDGDNMTQDKMAQELPDGNVENSDGSEADNQGGTPDEDGTSAKSGMKGGKGGMDFGGGGGGAFDTDSNCYISITGGNIYVDADGDGLDSNGVMVVSGGSTYVEGPTNSGNGALDYGTGGYITGGTIIASGASGMDETFTYAENQGAIRVTFSQMITGKIYIEDEDGNVLASTTTEKSFNSVVISCADIEEGKSYTIYAGDQSETVTMDSLLYGSSGMMGGGKTGMGFGGGRGDKSDSKSGTAGDGDTQGDVTEGGMQGGMSGDMPNGDSQGGDMSGGFDGGQGGKQDDRTHDESEDDSHDSTHDGTQGTDL